MLTSAKNEAVKFRDEREIYRCTRKRHASGMHAEVRLLVNPLSFCPCTHFVQRIYITLHRASAEEREVVTPEDKSIDRFHITSRRPYWCTKTVKWRPCWCTKPISYVGVKLFSYVKTFFCSNKFA